MRPIFKFYIITMRKKNSIPEFSTQRSKSLLQNFRASLAVQSQISLIKAFKMAAECPAPRFWVSEARATQIISSLLKGDILLEDMYPEKSKMYGEILRRVQEIRTRHPEMPLGDIVFEVVNSPAPSSYLSWHRAAKIIYSFKKTDRTIQ